MSAMYRKLIVEVTKCDPSRARFIVDLMRDRYGTLDGLTRKEFTREAKMADQQVDAVKTACPSWNPL